MQEQITPLLFPAPNEKSKFSDLKAGHIGIRTTAYTELIQWYVVNLDFRLIHEWANGEMQLALLAPPSDNTFLIEILGTKPLEQMEPSEIKSGFHHVCFNVGNLDHTIQELNNRNIPVIRCFTVPAIGKRVAFIEDTFGNVIELCEDLQ